MKNHDSIQLFKKNRETEATTQDLLTKEGLTNTKTESPELVITPLKFKDKKISSAKNSEESLLPPGIAKAIHKVSGILGIDRNDKISPNSLTDSDVVRKWSIWSIFRKPQ